MVSLFDEEAMAEARRCDEEAKQGQLRGPLHGVPMTVKEQFWVKGKRSNTNSKRLKDFVATADAVVVERLRRSGAILLGQTNVGHLKAGDS
jgi:Asp-tRNA(Asn)/Glu-tRNA(Gln) amidotransferase A subunit family amidase